MLNALGMDFRKIGMSKLFIFAALFLSVIAPALFVVTMEVIGNIMNHPFPCNMSCFQIYSNYAGLILACVVAYFLYTDSEEGILRNKLISGKKRTSIFLSYCIVNGLVAICMQILSLLSVGITGKLFGMEMAYGSFLELIRFGMVAAISGASLCVVFVTIFICFSDTKIASMASGVFSVVMMLTTSAVMERLSLLGSVASALRGTEFKVLVFLDKYVPFFYFKGNLRYETETYLIGCLATVLIALVVGCLVFSKRNLK